MIYIVDKIEDDIAVLENKDTREIINVNISCLPSLIKEGSVLRYDGSKYYIDNELEMKRRKDLLDRFKRLRNKNN